MSDQVDPQTVLKALGELRGWMVELSDMSRAGANFAFKWAARNGGFPTDQTARDKFLADYRDAFPNTVQSPDSDAMLQLEQHYEAWAKNRPEPVGTAESLERFDDETGLLTDFIDKSNGFDRLNKLAYQIAQRCDELSRTAIALGCDDATIAALKAAARAIPDVADGRASLSKPETWTEARHQACQIFQSEAIGGMPLHSAFHVALDKLEFVAGGRPGQPVSAAKLDNAATPTPQDDGPVPPNQLWFNGRSTCLEPIPWKLLEYAWQNRTAKSADVVEAVWGHDSDIALEGDGALKSALKRVNRALDDVSCPLHLSRKNDFITLA